MRHAVKVGIVGLLVPGFTATEVALKFNAGLSFG